ncbi:hypothetical protein TSUD_125190 [Trifolium subterraneum]|uniref:non-specific serine/threonine protein kinase n=1 Tax=Trifolium subterraneum TaxID=3900 RepID=A0A2Z6LQ55_TRISU|nr:hypothetical protein TSUD_125190 [Trifolium subterraneum]
MENDMKPNVLMEKYELGRLLGQGTFGKVYYARSKVTNQSVAIKAIDKDKVMRTGQVDRIKREIYVMKLARHPNIIQLFEVMATKSKIYFVIEYAKGGYLPFHDSNLIEMYRKISKAELKCPSWLRPEVCTLLSEILDPKPDTRISIEKIKEHIWFKNGPNVRNKKPKVENSSVSSSGTVVSDQSNENSSPEAEAKEESVVPISLNAFDIISLSASFDLSRFFKEDVQKKEARFSSKLPASVIISKMEDIAKQLRMKIKKKAAGLLKLEGVDEGRKGVLSIDAKIFEVTPNFHLVEVKKSNGDTLEYQKILKEDIRPGLQDIVWVWQTDQQLQSQQSDQELPIHDQPQQQPQP